MCHQLGPKPSVYPGLGKEWYPTWTIRDILNEVPQTSTPTDNSKNLNKSSFQEILLNKIRENKTRPSKKRRKINFLGAVITDEEYQREIAKFSSKNSSEKMALQKNKKKSKNSKTNATLEEQLKVTWNKLSPPIPEEDVISNWCGCLYETKGRLYLYIGRILKRFLADKNSFVTQLQIDCSVKEKYGASEGIYENLPVHLGKDIELFEAKHVLALAQMTPIPGGKWKVENIAAIKKIFNLLLIIN